MNKTKELIERVKKLDKEATPGPWKSDIDDGFIIQNGGRIVDYYYSHDGDLYGLRWLDGSQELTVNYRTDAPKLAEMLEVAIGALAEMSTWNGYGECVGQDMAIEMERVLEKIERLANE